MDLLIKGICLPCDGLLNLTIHEDGRVENNSTYAGHGVAVEISKHGDLIDRDALKKYIENTYCQKCKRDKILCHKNCDYGDFMEELDYAPVILEANR